MSELLEVLGAVDQLNSWVRSASFRFDQERLARRIYEAKRIAIERAHRDLVCTHRRIETLARCRECSGTGRYTDWGGHTWPHCRRCDSKGVVRLQFVETRVFADVFCGDPSFAWHTPREKFSISGFELPDDSSIDPDWTVQTKGRDLTPDDAAAALLVVDQWFPPQRDHRYCDTDLEYGRCHCTQRYTLNLGTLVSCCAHCGADLSGFAPDALTPGGTMQVNRCGRRIGRAAFTFAACWVCYLQKRNGGGLFDVGVPPELLAPIHIAEWVRVNDALAEPRREGRAA